MMYDVKPKVKDIKSLHILIDIVDRLYRSYEVKIIKGRLEKIMKDPAKHRRLSQAYIDDVFKPVKEDWADEKDDGGYGAIKPVFIIIKRLMFKENSKYPQVANGEEW